MLFYCPFLLAYNCVDRIVAFDIPSIDTQDLFFEERYLQLLSGLHGGHPFIVSFIAEV